MRMLSIIIFFLLHSVSFGQKLLPGMFMTHSLLDSSFFYRSTLTINCDKTFIFADSSIVGFGKWEIRKNKLLLHLDSTNLPELGYSVAGTFITCKISDDRLFCKVVPKKVYNKIPELYMRTFGKMPKLEKYSDFKRNNKYNYYERVSLATCF